MNGWVDGRMGGGWADGWVDSNSFIVSCWVVCIWSLQSLWLLLLFTDVRLFAGNGRLCSASAERRHIMQPHPLLHSLHNDHKRLQRRAERENANSAFKCSLKNIRLLFSTKKGRTVTLVLTSAWQPSEQQRSVPPQTKGFVCFCVRVCPIVIRNSSLFQSKQPVSV